MTTLIEFLTARLDEDEATAEAATAGPWRYNPGKHYHREWTVEFEESVFAGPPSDDATSIALTGESDDPQSMADAEHIARHDPARVLRELAAKRAILEQWEAYVKEQTRIFNGWPNLDIPPYMAALAAVYSDHPDFDPNWSTT